MLRRLTIVALALSLLLAQAAGAQNKPPGQANGNGNQPGQSWHDGKGFSDGR